MSQTRRRRWSWPSTDAAVLERVGFDEAVERGGIKSALAKSKYDASDIVGKIVYYALFLLVLQAAFGVFGDNPISDMINSVIAYLPKVFVAIVIVVVAAAVAAAVKDLVQNALSGLSYGQVPATVASTLIIVIGVFAALDQLEKADSEASNVKEEAKRNQRPRPATGADVDQDRTRPLTADGAATPGGGVGPYDRPAQ